MTRLRRAALCALLLPFLLASMLAAGTMPVRADTGLVTIVICIGDDLARIVVPADEAPPGHAPVAHPDCPWEDAASPALPGPVAANLIPMAGLSRADYPARQTQTVLGLRPRDVANRGPPARV
ncbi:hypothetical protein [Jannaschia donghaensis]|uniref:hypothetical protein n=1 Tax=Jannaschia donghaensis TaxID=420998 RepID=UPI0006D82F6D|nr:hypothetical protein [Jannaschia donghaensis]